MHTYTTPNNILLFEKKLKAGTYIIKPLQGKEEATLKIVKTE